MSSAVQSALVAAITAALVTYALEYSAKPWLEVRKARILEESQAFRSLQSALKRLMLAGRVTRMPSLVAASLTATAEYLTTCRSEIQTVHHEFTRVRIDSIPDEVLSVLSRSIGELDAVSMVGIEAIQSGQSAQVVTEILSHVADSEAALIKATDYLLLPRRRFISRRHHLRTMKKQAKEWAQLLDDEGISGLA